MANFDFGRRGLFSSKTQLLCGLAAFGFSLIVSGLSDAKTIYVNAARPEGGNGTSWGSAFKYLQEALRVSVTGDNIYIAKGKYYPDDFNADANGQNLNYGDREISFAIKAGVNLYGGFAGNEAALDQRDPVANETILSGEIWEVDPADPDTAGYQRYWSLHVLTLAGNATFDGLIIEKGRANGDNPPYNQGGGVYIQAGTLNLVNCTVRECLAAQDGGAIFGNVNATGCTFSDNRADNEFLLTDAKLNDPLGTQHAWIYSPVCSGGAIKGNIVANNCKFLNNTVRVRSLSGIGITSTASGGAISGNSVVVRRCEFDGNATDATSLFISSDGNSDATAHGGAIEASLTTAVDCVFTNNSAYARSMARQTPPNQANNYPWWTYPHSRGGAVYGRVGATNCVFADNLTTGEYIDGDNYNLRSFGGAVYAMGESDIVNSAFVGNETRYLETGSTSAHLPWITNLAGGGAVRAAPGSRLPLASSTFLDNETDISGTCLSVGGNVSILSNIFWDTFAAQETLIWVDGLTNESARARISNRLYPTPSTETINIVKGSLNGVNIFGSNADLGDPPGRSIPDSDPLFVDVTSPAGPDGVWKTADDGIRLTGASPAIGKGHPLFLPVDKFDLDEDGNTTETTPVDNANFARIQNATLDLGAYEFGDILLAPEIQVEDPAGLVLTDGVGTVTLAATAGVPVTRTFTIRNMGTLPLRDLRVSRSGPNSGAFTLAQPALQTLAAGRSTTFAVTFTPRAEVDLIAKLFVFSNDLDENPFDIDIIGRARIPQITVEQPSGTALVSGVSTVNYGNVDRIVGLSRTFVVRNSGDGDLVISRITAAGTHASDFAVSGVPARVAPNAFGTFVVTFKPKANGARMATLNIVSNQPGAQSTFVVNLRGTGVSAPEIEIYQPPGSSLVAGGSLGYGTVKTGLAFTKTFTIKNVGSANLNKIAVSISGAAVFKLVKPTAASLATGKTTKFTVTFKPTASGLRTAKVTVTSNDADESPFVIKVSGTGKLPGTTSKTKKTTTAGSGSSGKSAATVGTMTAANGLRYRTITVVKTADWNRSGRKVEVSSNLVDWFSGRKHTTVLVNDKKILKVRDNTPVQPGRKRHIRFK